jgi:hypothetical protein
VRAVDARVTDSFYSELRRCRDHAFAPAPCRPSTAGGD